MTRLRPLAAGAALLIAQPLLAQDLAPDALGDLEGTDALGSAAGTIADKVEDSLRVSEIIDAPLTGADGTEIATIEDLIVVPGGRIVAAIVELDDTRIAVPFAAAKLGASGADAGLQVPFTADELKGIDALADLHDSLTD